MKKLEDLKKELIGIEGTWCNVDNKILNFLELSEEYGVFSANPYDAMAFGHTYIIDNDKNEGFNIEFEVVEENEDSMLDVIVRVSNIDWV